MDALAQIMETMSPEDPNRQKIIDEMVELSDGISPASLTQAVSTGSPQGAERKPAVASDIGVALPQSQQ